MLRKKPMWIVNSAYCFWTYTISNWITETQEFYSVKMQTLENSFICKWKTFKISWIIQDSVKYLRRMGLIRRKIRIIESNAKYRHLKKLTCKGTLRLEFICLKPRTPYIPLTHYIRVYCIFIHTGKGRGVERWTREKGKGATGESADHKFGLKIPTWLSVRMKLAISSL